MFTTCSLCSRGTVCTSTSTSTCVYSSVHVHTCITVQWHIYKFKIVLLLILFNNNYLILGTCTNYQHYYQEK